MVKKVYTHREVKRPRVGMVLGLLAIVGCFAMILFTAPTAWTEVAAIGLMMQGLWMVLAWVTGSKKYSLIFSIWITGIVIMRRFGVLDWMLVGLWMAILGLISLIG